MTKTFLSNIALLVFLNLLVKPFFILGIDAEVQNQVGSESYGYYFALLNFSFLFNILLDLGINNFNTKSLAEKPNFAKNRIGPILGIRTLLFILYAAITTIFGVLIGYEEQQFYMLLVLIFNQFLVALLLYMRSNFSGLHLFKIDALISVLDRILLILICSYLLWFRQDHAPFQIEWFIYAQTASYAISVILALIISNKFIGKIMPSVKKAFSIAIIKQALPYALLIMLMMIYNRMDSVMIERIHPNGAEETGIYAQGYRLLDAVNMFALLFAGLLLPIFSRMIKSKEAIQEVVHVSGGVLIIGATIVSVSSFFYASEIIDWRYTETIEEGARSFGPLILSFIPVSITYIFGTLLTANGNLKILNVMALSGVLVNFLLNYFLIPAYGAYGAAIATLITQAITGLIQMLFAFRIFKLSIDFIYTLKLFIFLILLTFGSYFFHQEFPKIYYWLLLFPLFLSFATISGVFPMKKSLALFHRRNEHE